MFRVFSTVVLLAASLLAGHAASGASPSTCDDPDAPHRLRAVLTRLEAEGFWGTVLIERCGKIVLLEGYGYADPARRIRNEADSRYEIGSLTKTFTGAAILRLEAAGRLKTGDRLEKYLGRFPPAKAPATLEHLATHRAGLVPEGADLDSSSRSAFIESVRTVPAESAPGEKYRYTNAGYSVLAAVIEVVSGESYESYLRRELFAPAHLASADFRGGRPDKLSIGFQPGAGGAESRGVAPYEWGTRGAGGIVMSVPDLLRWGLQQPHGALAPGAECRASIRRARPGVRSR